MRAQLRFKDKTVKWTETISAEPPLKIGVPVVLSTGFGQKSFKLLGIVHTQNENSYAAYVEV
jgi:hypothetical protein